jgi:hypothetical protein
MDERHKEIMQAYQAASSQLRKHHDEEFHLLLARQYEQRGIDVKKRRSRSQIEKDRLAAARALVESSADKD